MARDKYEISLWEDYTVDAVDNIPAHFEERKLVVIGSNTMTTACRAYEPKLVENVNGTNTFTFKMFYVYTDEQTGEKRTNPFINLLINERKVKVNWKDKWYDLVIKNIQEDSNGKSITYTCKDLFINELSKNGFNLEFNEDIKDDAGEPNNQGTVFKLAEAILEGTDWQLDDHDPNSIKQEKEEPLYRATSSGFTAINERTGDSQNIPSGAIIYIFYSSVMNHQADVCQFLYDSTNEYNRDLNSQLIVDVPCYSYNSPGWDDSNPSKPLNMVSSMDNAVSNEYRGSRLVDSQKTLLDPLTKKYVKVYQVKSDLTPAPSRQTDGFEAGDIIYGYDSTEYKDPTFVNNLIVNNKNFANIDGWVGVSGMVGPFRLYPEYTDTSNLSTYTAVSYLKLGGSNSTTIYNSGLRESSSYIPNGIQIGEKYVFRYKARINTGSGNDQKPGASYINSSNDYIIPHIYTYTDDATNPIINVDYIATKTSRTDVDGWVECICTCTKSFSRNQILTENIGLFLTVSSTCWLESAEFFPLIYGEKLDNGGNLIRGRINPGEMEYVSISSTYHHYYNHTTHSSSIELDDYLYVGIDTWPGLSKLNKVSNNFAKIRSITAKQSNRFNLLQTLAETFECWCQFRIVHWGDNPNEVLGTHTIGEIKYVNGKYQKYVNFKEKIGREIGIGFIYGIDLKTISRTIQSDQIVTKTIVSQNNNEFATDGFCTIARSEENYTRDTFILNFDYYVTQGLLESGKLNKDLYVDFQWYDSNNLLQPRDGGGNIVPQGYYTQLHNWNIEYDNIADVVVQRKTEQTKQEAYQSIYDSYITSLQEEQNNLEARIMGLASVTTWADALDYIKKNPTQTEVVNAMNARQNCINELATYRSMRASITASLTHLSNVLREQEEKKTTLIKKIKELHYAFYKKYAHYIQEGSWINEDYVDDTLYYLDAQSVAYTSSRPQISYNISVARLSSLEEFKSKVFHLGDISYVQDTEFFGYVNINGINTPYKEQVLISEVTSNFDDPVQDSFKVQNYKTQFEDLFQRITATTQSLQYASGEYARAASIVETNGTIKVETLQDSIAYSNALVIEANNEQIVQDNTGITLTDTSHPNRRTRITSGGVFISTDGGETWKNAIRGEGVATQYLTAGNINTQNITIIDGKYQTFRWDSTGINAYNQIKDGQGNITNVDQSKTVRFDQYGIYGLDNVNNDYSNYIPTNEADIRAKADFGMTWSGFFLKNKIYRHYLEISNENDIRVVSTKDPDITSDDVERIKIGRISSVQYQPVTITEFEDGVIYYVTDDNINFVRNTEPFDENTQYYVDNSVYGIRLRDDSGNTTLETKENGTLWLQHRLNIGTSNGSYTASIGFLPLLTIDDHVFIDTTYRLIDAQGHVSYGQVNNLDLDTQRIIFNDNTSDTISQGLTLHRMLDIHGASGDSKFVVWEDGTLYAKDGYFEGTINAKNGYFQGTIMASSVISPEVQVGNVTMQDVANSAYRVVITSSRGSVFHGETISTILTAHLYKGANEVTTGTFGYTWSRDGTTISGQTQQTLEITNQSVTDNTTTYQCVIRYTEPTIQSGG